jgi:hypothetical protein
VRKFVLIPVLLCFVTSVPAHKALDPVATLQGDPQFGRRRNQRSPDEVQLERQQARARNKERQQKLKDDTDKLLQLATELKAYVDKTNENILSVDVIKKTEQIEKLAKSVREKMKDAGDIPLEDHFPAGR